MSTEPSPQTNESFLAMTGLSKASLAPDLLQLSGPLASPLPDDGSTTSPTAAESFSGALNTVSYSPTGAWQMAVEANQRDVSRGVAEAIQTVVVPAAEAKVGRRLSSAELSSLGQRFEREGEKGDVLLHETEFQIAVGGVYHTIALLQTYALDAKHILIVCGAGSEFPAQK